MIATARKLGATAVSKPSGDRHWLVALGSLLTAPVKAVFRPWWKQLVEEKAETEAVKNKVLEAIVRFRVNDFRRQQSVEEDRATGLAVRVTDRLRPLLSNFTAADLATPPFLAIAEQEIELAGIRLTSWATLACLASLGQFDPRQAITVVFTDNEGSQSHASTMISAFQTAFVFTKVLAVQGSGQAKLSPGITQLLKEYCSRTTLPSIAFQVSDTVPLSGALEGLTTPITLPKGWKPFYWVQPPE